MTLLTIVSDQVVPNVLFVKMFVQQAERLVLISTREMEEKEKSRAIVEALNPGLKVEKLVVDPMRLDLVRQKLQRLLLRLPQNEKFLVNITGGTKLLSMAVFSSFPSGRSTFYYLPINEDHLLEIKPDFSTQRIPLSVQLNLEEYLRASGLFFNADEQGESFSWEDVVEIYKRYRSKGFVIQHFPYEFAQQKCHFQVENENLPGHWFEDYVYHRLMRELELKPDQLARSVFLYVQPELPSPDQEVDFMFVYRNRLCMLELKVSLNKTDVAFSDLSKMNTLSQKFGLSTRTYFLTLSSLRRSEYRQYTQHFKNKVKLFGTTNIADVHDLSKDDFDWKQFFNTRFIS